MQMFERLNTQKRKVYILDIGIDKNDKCVSLYYVAYPMTHTHTHSTYYVLYVRSRAMNGKQSGMNLMPRRRRMSIADENRQSNDEGGKSPDQGIVF